MPRFSGVADGTSIDNQNALVASTLPRLSSEIADNFFTDLPFFAYLRVNNRVKPWSGGDSYEVNLMYGENPYAKDYDDYEMLDVGPPVGFANASYMRAKYRVPIMYAATTLSANSGRAQIYNLIEKLKMQAVKSIEKRINTDLLREDGTDDSSTTKITSLNYMLEQKAAASQDNIIGGIAKYDSGAQDWWVNQYRLINNSDDILKELRTSVVECTDGNDSPDLGLCDELSYLEIENAAFDKRRFVNSKIADFGFANVVYNGVTYMYDKGIESDDGDASGDGQTMHINTDHLYLAVCTDRNFSVIPPTYDVNQDVYLGAVITHLQLVADNLKRQGVVKGTAYIT